MLTFGEFAYFTTVTLIQTKLQAPDKARQLANDTLTAVTAKIRIDGFAELQQAVMDDPACARRWHTLLAFFSPTRTTQGT